MCGVPGGERGTGASDAVGRQGLDYTPVTVTTSGGRVNMLSSTVMV